MDLPQSRPSDAQIEALHGELNVESLDIPAHASVTRMLEWFRSDRDKGGAELAGFHIDEHPVFDWFATHRQLGVPRIMEVVLTGLAVREALPQFRITDPLTYNPKTGRSPRGWTEVWPLRLPGEWATYLDAGGVYTRVNELDPAERDARSTAAMETAMSSYADLTGNRYHPTITVYRTSDPWCDWFPGMLNGTWVVYDLRQRTLWLFAITDID
jgi:hypothetical protein